MVGVARSDARVDVGKLEYAIRDDLNQKAPRVLAVLDPVRVVLTNWPAGKVEEIDAPYYPHDVPLEGSRKLPFSGELYIDRQDFEEVPPPGFHRLTVGGEVRLRYGCVIRCDEIVKGPSGEIVELRCSYDRETWSGEAPTGRKVKGTIHWVSARHALPCEVRLYDRLFTAADPEAGAAALGEVGSFRDFLNPESLRVVTGAFVEPSIGGDAVDTRYQFERLGFFWRDPKEGAGNRLVFNRIVTLRDSWARASEREAGGVSAQEEARSAKKSGKKDGSVSKSAGGGGGSAVGEGGSAPRSASRSNSPLGQESALRQRELVAHFGIGEVDAGILARDPETISFYRSAVGAYPDSSDSAAGHHPQIIARWIINQLPPVQEDRELAELPFGPREFASLVALVERGIISHRGGNEALGVLAKEGGDPEEIVGRLGLAQVGDTELLASHISEILAENPEKVAEYRNGRTNLMGFFMGQLMRRTGGKADPEVAKELVEKALE
jgi:glutaminyl-tRNA synthetase